MAAQAVPVLVPGTNDIHYLLYHCGVDAVNKRNSIIATGGWGNDLELLSLMDDDAVNSLSKRLEALPANRGRVTLTSVQIMFIKGACSILQKQQRNNEALSVAHITAGVILQHVRENQAQDDDDGDDTSSKLKRISKFEPANWVQWELELCNYLRSITGSNGVCLYYVIRKPVDAVTMAAMDPTELSIYTTAHNGVRFNKDNKKVYQILKSFLLGTDGYEWMRDFDTTQDGLMAMKTLRDHYDGADARTRRIAEASEGLKNVHYVNETTFSFELYITKLKGFFQSLSDNGEPKTETEKVRILCDKIKCDSVDVRSAVRNIQMNPILKSNFLDAANALSEQIALIFPKSAQQNRTANRYSRRVGSASTGGRTFNHRGGGKAGRGRGRGGRGIGWFTGVKDGKTYEKGVDITDLSKRIPTHLYNRLSYETKGKIRAARAGSGDDNKSTSGRSIGSLTMDEFNDAVHRAVKQASTDNQVPDAAPATDNDASSASGSAKFGKQAYSGDKSKSKSNYNAYIAPVRIIKYDIMRNVSSSSSACIASAIVNPAPNTYAMNELDSHADTTCAGSNMVCLSTTNQLCTVRPFLDEYAPTQSIPIVTAATAYTCKRTGITYILVFHQVLWFGTRMQNSLINPNQLRHQGVKVQDNPYDPSEQLHIHEPCSGLRIPLESSGVIIGLETRTPTKEELRDCPYIVMTNANPWRPRDDIFPRDVASLITHNPVEAELLHESDVCLKDVSTIYHPESLASAIVSSVESDIQSPTLRGHFTDIKVSSANSTNRKCRVTPEQLSKKWDISLQQARDTLRATTQYRLKEPVHPLTRRFKTGPLFDYKRLDCIIFSDTGFSKYRSIAQNTCFQIYCGRDFVQIHPMRSKSEAGYTLSDFANDVGAPRRMVLDGSLEQTAHNSLFQQKCRNMDTNVKLIEAYSYWQNYAESMIREVKRKWKKIRTRKNIPEMVWDYGFRTIAEQMSRTAKGRDRRTGYERITGNTPDIAEWMDYEFYDWCFYWDQPGDDNNPHVGRWLGVSHREGSRMCYYILTPTCKVISRTTVTPFTESDKRNPDLIARCIQITNSINEKLEDSKYYLPHPDIEDDNSNCRYIVQDYGDLESPEEHPDADEDDPKSLDEILEQGYTYDELIKSEVVIPTSDGFQRGVVRKRLRDNDGNPIGQYDPEPKLNTAEYEVEFDSGEVREYTANLIVENLVASCDDKGILQPLISAITDHSVDDSAVKKADGYFVSPNGIRRKKITTRGWKFRVEWRDGTTNWVHLRHLKDSFPIQLAEYAVNQGISDEPAFAWWVKDTIRRRDRLISKVKTKYWQTTHKHGVELPHSVLEALAIDKKNGNTYWRDAIEKEMKNCRIAFETIEDYTVEQLREDPTLMPGFIEIDCHMIFDVKMDGKLTRKARFVAGGHMTDVPDSQTYASVVSRDTVRIAFLMASLLGLDMLTADIGNAFLNAPCAEKIWCKAGPEFGPEDNGKPMKVVRALYGLRSSAFAWRQKLSETMRKQNFYPCKADPDLWMRPACKDDGTEYYEYVLIYVDDLLILSHDPHGFMKGVSSEYRLKDGSVQTPERYLGATISKQQLPDGRSVWAQSCKDYSISAVKSLEKTFDLDGEGMKLNSKITMPMDPKYRPELDISSTLNDKMQSRFQNLIGILRWMCELGRIDILQEVSKLSAYNAQAREGHLHALYRIFAYIKKFPEVKIVFDDRIVPPEAGVFKRDESWSEFYPEASEPIPDNMPTPRSPSVNITCFVDADHAGNVVTRRSHTGYIIYINNAPILWLSRRQTTVESSTYGSELNALRIATDAIQALRYKLRMMGITVDSPAHIYCDNRSVTTNARDPTSQLSKKHNSVCYHRVREAVASGMILVGWINSEDNIADVFTKTLDYNKRMYLLSMAVYNLGNSH